jgi:hypothetical protein
LSFILRAARGDDIAMNLIPAAWQLTHNWELPNSWHIYFWDSLVFLLLFHAVHSNKLMMDFYPIVITQEKEDAFL